MVCKDTVLNITLPAGVLIAGLFIFVPQLRFTNGSLLGVGILIGLLRVSSGVTAGGRARGAAMLVMSTLSMVLAGITVSILGHFCQTR